MCRNVTRDSAPVPRSRALDTLQDFCTRSMLRLVNCGLPGRQMADPDGSGAGTTDVRLLEIDTGAIAIWTTSDEELDREAPMAWRQVGRSSVVAQYSHLSQR